MTCADCSAPHETSSWPPRFHKLLLHCSPRPGEPAGATCDFAYCDARRFGKVKLCDGDPAASEAISKLGFDPLTDMPGLQAFQV
jgi:formamidopyrimidine-DNA glycosylase